MLTASAASPAVAQLLYARSRRAGRDRRGRRAGLARAARRSAASVLPLVLAGILTGVLAVTLASGALARAASAGRLGARGPRGDSDRPAWLDVVGGDWPANAGALSLTVLAIASVVAGL